MKRQIFTLLMVFVLARATALVAQTTGTSNSQLPPSQQVDETNKPETGPGPDVDVDLGRNAEDGVVDVDVNRQTDSDTAAQGNDSQATGTTGTTGTMGTTGSTNLNNQNNTNTGTTDTTTGAYGDTDTGMAGDSDSLPGTASKTPLFGLIGLLSLGLAFTLRTIR